MKERIILAPGCNGSELLRSLAQHGINSLNLRILNAYDLAYMALIRSGITIEQEFVNHNEECAILSRAARKEKYFGDISYADTLQLASAIRTTRSLVTDPNELKTVISVFKAGIFTEKNNALANVYESYINELVKDNKIDSIMLIKKAIAESKPIDAEFMVMPDEYPLNGMEQCLISKVSGDRVVETNLAELYNLEKDSQVRIQNYYSCFGSPNEVENILSIIYRGLPLDKCVVAVTNPLIYSQLFFDYSLLHNIPMTFGTGIPIGNSNPAKLLKMYYRWMTDKMYSGVTLVEIINNSVFDKNKLLDKLPKPEGFSLRLFFDVLKDLRLTNQNERNTEILNGFEKGLDTEEMMMSFEGAKALSEVKKKRALLEALKAFSDEITAPCEIFISRYAKTRKQTGSFAEKLLMKLDYAASRKIFDELSAVRASGIEQTDEDIIKNLAPWQSFRTEQYTDKKGATRYRCVSGCKTPSWWSDYNKVKHNRMLPSTTQNNYAKANFRNLSNAYAALYTLERAYMDTVGTYDDLQTFMDFSLLFVKKKRMTREETKAYSNALLENMSRGYKE